MIAVVTVALSSCTSYDDEYSFNFSMGRAYFADVEYTGNNTYSATMSMNVTTGESVSDDMFGFIFGGEYIKGTFSNGTVTAKVDNLALDNIYNLGSYAMKGDLEITSSLHDVSVTSSYFSPSMSKAYFEDDVKYTGNNTYSATVAMSVDYGNANKDAVYGFVIDGTYYSGTLNGEIVTAKLENLTLGRSYQITPKASLKDLDFSGTSASVTTSADVFKPYFATTDVAVSVDEIGKLSFKDIACVRDSTVIPTSASLKLGSSSYPMTITKVSAGQFEVKADVVLENLSEGSYANATIEVSNAIGSGSQSIALGLTISSNSAQYSDDGMKDDCIRLCGIDWAKGNLQYYNGTWRIAPEQQSILNMNNSTLNYNSLEHFIIGKTGNTSSVYTSGSYAGLYTRETTSSKSSDFSSSIQGDSTHDVATAKLGVEWQIPDNVQWSTLYSNASYIKGMTYTSGGATVNGVLFLSPGTKKYTINHICTFSNNIVDKGLFLPACGFWDYDNTSLRNVNSIEGSYYASSTVLWKLYNTRSWTNTITWTKMYTCSYYLEPYLFNMSSMTNFSEYYYYHYQDAYPIRPVKSE